MKRQRVKEEDLVLARFGKFLILAFIALVAVGVLLVIKIKIV